MTSPSRDPVQEARDDDELRSVRDGSLRMNGYYIHFDLTGVVEVDRVLSAVACAGKGYHNTDGWTEGGYTDLIQKWADRAAAAFREREPALRASLVEAVVGKVEGMKVSVGHLSPRNRIVTRGRIYNYALDDVLAVLRAELNSGEGGK